jgi:hypothetical protein
MYPVTGVGESPFKALGHPAKERFHGSFGLSRQLHRLPLWRKEFSRSLILFILCMASSLRSSATGTIGEVTFYDTPGHVRALPAAWTSLAPPDPNVILAAGRAAFRVADLLQLSQLIHQIDERKEEGEC